MIHALTKLCERPKELRAVIVRTTIAEYLARHQPVAEEEAFGLWGPDAADGPAYQEKARAEW
ncbi:MAG: CopG family transcriptional regulator [Acetobacteraceae bacterium]